MKPDSVVVERSRVDAVLESVERMAAGELQARVPVSPARDELDALAHGVNVLAAELERRRAELAKAQVAIEQASKLAVLGEVTSSLAHELNNPLAIVHGYLELTKALLRRDGTTDEVWRYLTRVDASVERMASIIRHVHTFSRSAPPERAPIALDVPIRNAALLVAEQLRARNVRLDLDLAPQLLLEGDGVRLEQVFLNLLTNARDAIWDARGEAGGTITVRAQGGDTTVEAHVVDDGIGMSEEVRARMFDPFFTTKAVGRGAGLGLSISHGIVEEHLGHVQVESTVGGGTRFRISFPRMAARA